MSKTIRLRAVRLYEAAKYDFYKDKLTPEVFNVLNNIYPKFSVWLIREYLKDTTGYLANLNPVREKDMKEMLSNYEKLVNWGYFKTQETPAVEGEDKKAFCPPEDRKFQDLQKASFLDIYKMVGSGASVYISPAMAFLEQMKFRNYKKEMKFKTIYKDDDWWIAHPENHEACIYFGSGELDPGKPQADWCVSKKNTHGAGHYRNYSSNTGGTSKHCPILFIQKLDDKDRWLVGGNEDMFNDSTNILLDSKNQKHPERTREWLRDSLPDEAIGKADEFTNNTFSELLSGTGEDFGTCDRCGDNFAGEDDQFSIGNDVWCENCMERYSSSCDRCSNSFFNEDMYTDDNSSYCRRCYENYYATCEDCNDIVRVGDVEEGDDGNLYCENCINDHRETGYANKIRAIPEMLKHGVSFEFVEDVEGRTAPNHLQGASLSIQYLPPDGTGSGWLTISSNYGELLDKFDKVPIDFSKAHGLMYNSLNRVSIVSEITANIDNDDAEDVIADYIGEGFADMVLQKVHEFAINIPELSHQGYKFDYVLFRDSGVTSGEETVMRLLVGEKDDVGATNVTTRKAVSDYYTEVLPDVRVYINPRLQLTQDKQPLSELLDSAQDKNERNSRWYGPGKQQDLHPNERFTPGIWESLMNIPRLGRM